MPTEYDRPWVHGQGAGRNNNDTLTKDYLRDTAQISIDFGTEDELPSHNSFLKQSPAVKNDRVE